MKTYHLTESQDCGVSYTLTVSCNTTATNETGQAIGTRTTNCPTGIASEVWTIVVDGETLYQGAGSGIPGSLTPTQGNHAGIEIQVEVDATGRTLTFTALDGFDDQLTINLTYTVSDACGNNASSDCSIVLQWTVPVADCEILDQSEGIINLTAAGSTDANCPSGITSYFWEVVGLTVGDDYQFVNGTSQTDVEVEIDLSSQGVGTFSVKVTVTTSCGESSSTCTVTVGTTNTTIANDDIYDVGFGFIADGTTYNLDLLANDTDPEGDNQAITHIGGTPVVVDTPIVVSNATFTLKANGTVDVFTNTAQTVFTTYQIVDDNVFPATDTAAIQIVFAEINGPTSTSPVDSYVCESSTAQFVVSASDGNGGTLSYQWERSINNGLSFNPVTDTGEYSGSTTNTLTITGTPLGFDFYQFRCVITESPSGLTFTTTSATLEVIPNPTATTNGNQIVAEGNAGIFVVTLTNSPKDTVSYQWQESTDGGSIWNNVVDGGDYSGAQTNGLTVQNPDASKDTYQYQCIITYSYQGVDCPAITSPQTLSVQSNTTNAVDDAFFGPFIVGVTYNFNPLQNDFDVEGDGQSIVAVGGIATIQETFVSVPGIGQVKQLINGTIDVIFDTTGTPLVTTYQILDDNVNQAGDSATIVWDDVIQIGAVVKNDLNDDPPGFVRGDGSGSVNSYVNYAIDENADGTLDAEAALPLSVGPVANGGGSFVTPDLSPFTGGEVYVVQVWNDANRTSSILAEDRKRLPTPTVVADCNDQTAIAVTNTNGSPDTVANTYTPGNYNQINDVFYVDIIADTLQGTGWGPLSNVFITIDGLSADALDNSANGEISQALQSGGVPLADADILAAAISGTYGSYTVDGDVFSNYGTGSLFFQLRVDHTYTDGAIMSSLLLSSGSDIAFTTCAGFSPPLQPTATIVWDGSKTNPDNTSMTIGGLKADGSTPHDSAITYDVTFTTHIGTYTVTNVQRGNPIPAGEVINIQSNTGVQVLSGNVENFNYQHPALETPIPTLGANSQLLAGSTVQYGVDIQVVANEGALSSGAVQERSFFHTYTWDQGESSGNSVNPWGNGNSATEGNAESGIPSTWAGFWYVEGITGPGTSVAIGTSPNYKDELVNNNHGGGGGPFSTNQQFMYEHGQTSLEIEVETVLGGGLVYLDAMAGAGVGPLVLGDTEFESCINWAESQAAGTNGAVMKIGSVNGKFIESNDPESVLFGKSLPGVIGGLDFGNTASGGWGGWYELAWTQAVMGNMRMQDPATLEYHIWTPSIWTR